MSRLSLLLLLSVAGCDRGSAVQVDGNAAWAHDADAILIASSARVTPSDAPWYADPRADSWEVVFSEAGPELDAPTELLRVPDVSSSQGGGILSAPLYWLRDHDLAVAIEYHQAVTYNLSSGVRRELTLPSSIHRELFDLGEIDLRPYAAPMAAVPSPDGETIAVHYSAPLLGDSVFGDMYFYHAVAFFERDGTFIAHNDLAPWRGGTHQLRRTPQPPSRSLPVVEPPAHDPHGFVASFYLLTFVWQRESEGVVFVASDWDGEEFLGGKALFVDRDTGEATEVDRVPRVGQAAQGGFANHDGTYLITYTPEGAPDEVELRLYSGGFHRPFGTGLDVSIEEIGWTY
ncbi:MAG: hypothetical protein EA397_01060 [Deltaproteobacteria bacterium]|nr:MAG: hypothetical protein EA397_01060 [Deltaproteobacteria bacterium]